MIKGTPAKQTVRYCLASGTASAGVDSAARMPSVNSSSRAVAAREKTVKMTAVLPMQLEAARRSPAPMERLMATVLPMARPTMMTVSMWVT